MNIGFKKKADSKSLLKLRPDINNSKYILQQRKTIIYNSGISNIITYISTNNINKGGLTFNTASPIIEEKWILETGFPYYAGFEYYPEDNKNLLEKIWMEKDMINVINIDFIKEESI